MGCHHKWRQLSELRTCAVFHVVGRMQIRNQALAVQAAILRGLLDQLSRQCTKKLQSAPATGYDLERLGAGGMIDTLVRERHTAAAGAIGRPLYTNGKG